MSCMTVTLLQPAVQANQLCDSPDLACQPSQQSDLSELTYQPSQKSELPNTHFVKARKPCKMKPLNAELNSICHFLVLLGADPILHISRIRVNHMCWLLSAVSSSTLWSADPTIISYT
jgi:hypothetical protein